MSASLSYLTLLLFALTGCQSDTASLDDSSSTSAASDSLPTEDDARAVANSLPYVQNGSVRILSVTKTNGQAGEIYGVPIYQMSVAVEWECAVPHGPMVEVDRSATLTCAHDDPAGARATSDGEILFERTEQGWRGSVTPLRPWPRRG